MSTGRVTETCPHCAAPVELTPKVERIQCRACWGSVYVVWTRRPPPPAERTDPLTLYVQPPPPSRLLWLLPAAFAGLVALGFAADRTVPARSAPATARALESTTFPVSCAAREKVLIEGQTHSGSGPLVTARDDCSVTISRSRLTSDVVVDLGGAATVKVIESTLEGGEAAVRLQDHASVRIESRSVLRGETGIVGEGEVSIELLDSVVEGKTIGIGLASNARVDAKRTKVSGEKYGIEAFARLSLTGDALTLEGERALHCRSGLRATLNASTLSARDIAIDTGALGRIVLGKGTRLSAGKIALMGDSQLQVEAEGATLEGGQRGIDAQMHASIQLRDAARVTGKEFAISSDAHLLLRLDSAKVESAGVAVCSTVQADIAARRSAIEGDTAFQFQGEPKALALDDTHVKGARSVHDAPCGVASFGDIGERGVLPAQETKVPKARNGPGPAFDFDTAAEELDRATREASAVCHQTRPGNPLAIVDPGFTPDGRNLGASIRNQDEIGEASACILRFFRKIRVRPYDPSENPNEMFRIVTLK